MNDVIRLLPDSVANQIAAGEVIQRPASVIKELVENAVDAGATEIRIYVKDAGRTLIQVVDNGCGMSPTDARLAFERHATSKIRAADDLFALRTMGFRGEALPSICAIAQIELLSRRPGESMGTRLLINGSHVELQEAAVSEAGTSISVRNLFFNVPARRKFLKSDNVELSNVMREFERLALVNEGVRMSIDIGSRSIDLRAATFRQRVEDLWKHNLKMELLPVEVHTDLVEISGFISRPENARRRNALQFLFVNGRHMRHPYFHKAIVSCYDGLIASDTQPCYFIKFKVDPSTIDVNIHPTKNEIKFEYESDIWPLLTAAVKAALGKFSAVPSIDFTADTVPAVAIAPEETPEPPRMKVTGGYNPFRQSARGERDSIRNWESLYSDFIRRSGEQREEPRAVQQPVLPQEETDAALSSECRQFALKYIVTISRDGLLLIDQHRAHVRVLYEQYLAAAHRCESVGQTLVFPERVEIPGELQDVLAEVEPQLARLGFSLEYEEQDIWRIVSVPATLRNVKAADTVMRLLESAMEESDNFGKDVLPVEAILRQMALALARAAAVKGGTPLSGVEMEQLVADLFALPEPALTPNGNRVYTALDAATVARMLG